MWAGRCPCCTVDGVHCTDRCCLRVCVCACACITCSELAEHTTLFDVAAAPHHPGEHVGQCSQPPGTAGSEEPRASTNTAPPPPPPPPSLVIARWRQLQRLGLRLLWLRHEPVVGPVAGPVAGPVRDHEAVGGGPRGMASSRHHSHRHGGQDPAVAAAAGQRCLDPHQRARSSSRRRRRPRPRRPDLAPDAAWNLRRTEGGAERALNNRWGMQGPAAAAAVPAAALSSAEACFERGDGHRCLIQVGPCHRADPVDWIYL
jgi:hypothetical protein